MVYQAYLLFGIPPDFAYLSFTFLGTLCSYNFHWYLTPASFGGSYKAAWSIANKKLHAALFLVSLGGAIYFGWQLLPHWPWLLATAFLTFLYSAPKIPHAAARYLQQIAIGKTFFLAFAWTHVTALLPLVLESPQLTNPEIFYVVNRFFLIYAICILFDYRDQESDREQGIRSVITRLDPEGVHLYFWGNIAAFFGSCLLLPFMGFALPQVLALAVPGIILAALFRYSLHQRGDYLYYLVLDGLMALSLPLLVLFY